MGKMHGGGRRRGARAGGAGGTSGEGKRGIWGGEISYQMQAEGGGGGGSPSPAQDPSTLTSNLKKQSICGGASILIPYRSNEMRTGKLYLYGMKSDYQAPRPRRTKIRLLTNLNRNQIQIKMR